MIRLNAHLADPPPVHPTRFIHQAFEPAGYFALDHASPISWDPDQMVLQPVLGMRPSGISGHSPIMPDLPPLRQPELASFRVPFIPRLKPGVYWRLLLNINIAKTKTSPPPQTEPFERNDDGATQHESCLIDFHHRRPVPTPEKTADLAVPLIGLDLSADAKAIQPRPKSQVVCALQGATARSRRNSG
jgi:hypothetical protein